MPLTPESRDYLGEILLVTPYYGWGWARTDPGAPGLSWEEASRPRPFHVRVNRFIENEDGLLGGMATIEEPGDPLDGLFFAFFVRHVGTFDFISALEGYNVEIGPELKTDGAHVVGSPRLSGFAEIRDEARAGSNRYGRPDH